MTLVTVVKRSAYPVSDSGLGVVVGTRVTYRTAAGPVAAVVVAARREPGTDARTYRLTLDVPTAAAPSRQRAPVCPICGSPARAEPVGDGRGLRCAGDCAR